MAPHPARILRIKSYLISVLVLSAIAAPACLNDRDTLADEAKKNRDILTTLVGGFERNPPLYYQMRIDRIKKDLAKNPKLIDQYDDIAVANDRIANDDEAIKWIELKKKQLAPLDLGSETSKDEWYRYYANCGTFWAHRWGHNGADYKKIDQVVHGRDLIIQALQINPNAHFGREKYQCAVMNWLIDNSKPNDPKDPHLMTLGEYIEQNNPATGPRPKWEEETVEGLSGLIRLGGAWQSADVYWAIGSFFRYPHQAMAQICDLRAQEIIDAGGKSLDPTYQDAKTEMGRLSGGPPLTEDEVNEYHRLRNLADGWNDKRQAFMLAKLKVGDHPDTNPHFWDGAPQMPDFTVRGSLSSTMAVAMMRPQNQLLFAVLIYLVLPITLLVVFTRWVKKRRRFNVP